MLQCLVAARRPLPHSQQQIAARLHTAVPFCIIIGMKHPRPSVPQQWQPASWRACPAAQQPAYPRAKALQRVRALMHGYPPLVVPGEIERLRAHVADAGAGHTFILQGGNCAEQFSDCTAATIMNQLKILLQMSVILTHGARKPVVRIGRIEIGRAHV